MKFDFEKLDVYQAAVNFVVTSDDIIKSLPRGRSYFADQLQRAATSIALNIAEGAGEFSAKEKARFYRIALRSATESASLLDVCLHLKLIEHQLFLSGRDLLIRIISMLTKIIKSVIRKKTFGSGKGNVKIPRCG